MERKYILKSLVLLSVFFMFISCIKKIDMSESNSQTNTEEEKKEEEESIVQNSIYNYLYSK